MSKRGLLTRVQWRVLSAMVDSAEGGCGAVTPDDLGPNGMLTLRALRSRRLVVLAEGPAGDDDVELWRVTLRGLIEMRARRARQAAWARSGAVIALVPGRAPPRTRKLTREQVLEARAEAGTTACRALARRYGVSHETMRGVLSGVTYAEVV